MILKEWKEFYRSSLLVMTFGLVVLFAWFILFQYRGMDVPVSFRTGLVPIFQTSLYFLPLLATVYGAFSMVLEKSQRTLPILLARGMTIQQFVLQKFLALFSAFLPTIATAYLVAMIPAKLVFGSISIKEFALFIFSIILLTAVFIAIGILLGAMINQKLTLIGAIIGIWLALIYLFDLFLMYWLPSVSMNDIAGFSIIYFLSPVHAVQYFLFVELNVYKLSDLSVIYEQFTFQSTWLVLISNVLFWIGIAICGSIYVLKRKGVSHD
ncbi:ABC transporter permease [Virgibacillus byunsanensis]|uniref:ABC transporter permease n=1 Tax=Virgibacillus byunsanensis TaxID=570945 RepID=A0ABW3LQ36_9BACI